MERIANAINTLGAFLGARDVNALTPQVLQARFGFDHADVMVLFGGSILAGGDLLAEAMDAGIADRYVIVGGEGHTTQSLRDRVHAEYPSIETDGLPEAEVFSLYLKQRYGKTVDALETKSTNCGNNITYLLDLLKEKGFAHKSIILCQDASMQRRMDAGLRKYAPETTIINYAAYRAAVTAADGTLGFSEEIRGMWSMDRYIELLMGEIPRLTDDENGYGPKGKGFIAHTDVPETVRESFETLKEHFGIADRAANPLYASQK